MSRISKRVLLVIAAVPVLALVGNFIFPFGLITKFASPNCGPWHWRWLGDAFNIKCDVVLCLQEHEFELLRGSQPPRLGEYPAGSKVSLMEVVIDWQPIVENIQVEHRPGYVVYSLINQHPACSESQFYTFKVTRMGWIRCMEAVEYGLSKKPV